MASGSNLAIENDTQDVWLLKLIPVSQEWKGLREIAQPLMPPGHVMSPAELQDLQTSVEEKLVNELGCVRVGPGSSTSFNFPDAPTFRRGVCYRLLYQSALPLPPPIFWTAALNMHLLVRTGLHSSYLDGFTNTYRILNLIDDGGFDEELLVSSSGSPLPISPLAEAKDSELTITEKGMDTSDPNQAKDSHP